jgi:hypothetical protein
VRTSPDSYGWQRSYVELNGCIICSDCAAKAAAEILESFEGNWSRAVTSSLSIDPADHGYVKLDQRFEHGLYGGQDDSPEVIAKSLIKRGITRYLFLIDDCGQFDLKFSAWVHESQKDLMPTELEHGETACALDPAVGMARALQNMPHPDANGGIVIGTARTDGTSSARVVSPEEFIKGIKP